MRGEQRRAGQSEARGASRGARGERLSAHGLASRRRVARGPCDQRCARGEQRCAERAEARGREIAYGSRGEAGREGRAQRREGEKRAGASGRAAVAWPTGRLYINEPRVRSTFLLLYVDWVLVCANIKSSGSTQSGLLLPPSAAQIFVPRYTAQITPRSCPEVVLRLYPVYPEKPTQMLLLPRLRTQIPATQLQGDIWVGYPAQSCPDHAQIVVPIYSG